MKPSTENEITTGTDCRQSSRRGFAWGGSRHPSVPRLTNTYNASYFCVCSVLHTFRNRVLNG
jgi:hypothetical protein